MHITVSKKAMAITIRSYPKDFEGYDFLVMHRGERLHWLPYPVRAQYAANLIRKGYTNSSLSGYSLRIAENFKGSK